MCCDRIICNLAMLVSTYNGMPLNACKTHAKTLKQIRYNLKFALGLSKKFMCIQQQLQYTDLARGAVRHLTSGYWLTQFWKKCLDEAVPGMMMHNIQKDNIILQSNIDGFVDGTPIFVNLPFQVDNWKELREVLRKARQTWSVLINASGGKLELKKSFYYILS